MTTFGDQVYQYGGAPVGGGRFSSPWATHYFVDAINGTANGAGTRPDKAFSTIQAAVTKATGGDIIYIRPKAYTLGTGFARYIEDVTLTQGGTTGSGQTATNARISLIGITPQGVSGEMLGVRWKVSATNGTNFTVQAPGTHIENIGFFNEEATGRNIYFQSGMAARTYGGGDGSSLYNCDLKGGAAVYSNGGSALQIVNCSFGMKHDGSGTELWLEGTGDNDGGALARPRIQNCTFQGGNANNCTTSPVIIQGSVYDLNMRDCYFTSIGPDSGDYIQLSGVCDGIVANCYFADASAEGNLGSLAGGDYGVFSAGCYDETGIIAMTA